MKNSNQSDTKSNRLRTKSKQNYSLQINQQTENSLSVSLYEYKYVCLEQEMLKKFSQIKTLRTNINFKISSKNIILSFYIQNKRQIRRQQ